MTATIALNFGEFGSHDFLASYKVAWTRSAVLILVGLGQFISMYLTSASRLCKHLLHPLYQRTISLQHRSLHRPLHPHPCLEGYHYQTSSSLPSFLLPASTYVISL